MVTLPLDKAVELAKQAAKNDQVQKAAKSAVAGAAAALAKAGLTRAKKRNVKRGDRKLAIDLARQMGGTYSVDTVIAGHRHYVVWKREVPIEVFPTITQNGTKVPLAERHELKNFRGRRLTPAST